MTYGRCRKCTSSLSKSRFTAGIFRPWKPVPFKATKKKGAQGVKGRDSENSPPVRSVIDSVVLRLSVLGNSRLGFAGHSKALRLGREQAGRAMNC
jgi:hypothetical protein